MKVRGLFVLAKNHDEWHLSNDAIKPFALAVESVK